MRLSGIAEHLTELEARAPDELHIKLRNPAMKGMFNGTPGRSRNSPADYAPRELARARLLLALADTGLDTTDLARVNRVLNEPLPVHPQPRPASMGESSGGPIPNALQCIIRGARAGEPWFLRVEIAREAGVRKVFASVDCGRIGICPEEDRAIAARRMTAGPQVLAYSFCPAADLIAPLLHLIPEDAA